MRLHKLPIEFQSTVKFEKQIIIAAKTWKRNTSAFPHRTGIETINMAEQSYFVLI